MPPNPTNATQKEKENEKDTENETEKERSIETRQEEYEDEGWWGTVEDR